MTTTPAHEQSLRFLPGIGPARAKALAEAGLETVWDLLHLVPRLLPPPPPVSEHGMVPLASQVRVRARVLQARPVFMRGRGMSVEARLERADGMTLRARFFNAGWLRRHLIVGEWYIWEGRTDQKQVGVLIHPTFTHLPGGAATPADENTGPRVAYRGIEGVSERTMADLAAHALTTYLSTVVDPAGLLPNTDYQAQLAALHQPTDATAYDNARRVIAARELTAMAWVMQERRHTITAAPGHAWQWNDTIDERARQRLPFTLTPAQNQALSEIRRDLHASTPMYRLLNGDVGSGKTAVALVAMLAVIADGAQTVLLAPTAVLAQQHARFISSCLAGSRVMVATLTGGTNTNEREHLLEQLADGRIGLLIATHAVLEADIHFKALGLLVIDEQHKFGVAQRAAVITRAEAAQGWRPDLLLMTATPIPRTLALTAFGDLALSRIAGRPPGRAPVTTALLHVHKMYDLDRPVRDAIASDGQVFVICPLRTASERISAADAEQVAQHFSTQLGSDQVTLVHGTMSEADKIAQVQRFAAGDVRVLVATTVIEVGIDIPRATLLLVLNADRFGLSQLHQLRGRLGRGDRPGTCLLCHRSDDADTMARLEILVHHDDGLAIAEADLAARGAGSLLGTDQHGISAFRVAELPRDLDLLAEAHAVTAQRAADGVPPPPLLLRLLPTHDATLLAGG